MSLLERAGFEVRRVDSWCRDGRRLVGAEVRLGILRSLEAWHFFDLTHGSFYVVPEGDLLSLLSLHDLRRGVPSEEIANRAELSRYVAESNHRSVGCF